VINDKKCRHNRLAIINSTELQCLSCDKKWAKMGSTFEHKRTKS
jgi:hypothetical protein